MISLIVSEEKSTLEALNKKISTTLCRVERCILELNKAKEASKKDLSLAFTAKKGLVAMIAALEERSDSDGILTVLSDYLILEREVLSFLNLDDEEESHFVYFPDF